MNGEIRARNRRPSEKIFQTAFRSDFVLPCQEGGTARVVVDGPQPMPEALFYGLYGLDTTALGTNRCGSSEYRRLSNYRKGQQASQHQNRTDFFHNNSFRLINHTGGWTLSRPALQKPDTYTDVTGVTGHNNFFNFGFNRKIRHRRKTSLPREACSSIGQQIFDSVCSVLLFIEKIN